jgi:hypothetical protein
VSKAASERLQTVLVAVRQGAVGLAQRLAPFNSLLGFDEPDALAGTQASLESTGRMLVCQLRRFLGHGANSDDLTTFSRLCTSGVI